MAVSKVEDRYAGDLAMSHVSDSSMARMHWEDDGGPCPRLSGRTSAIRQLPREGGILGPPGNSTMTYQTPPSPSLPNDSVLNNPALWDELCARIHGDLCEIAELVSRRLGRSPDGVAQPSDLAQSVALRIHRNPRAELHGVVNTDDLRGRLYQLLLDRWIDRRRKALAAKRGGGQVRPASQIGAVGASSPFDDAAAPSRDDASSLLTELLEVFDVGSEFRTIVERLLAGFTHAEIARQLGKSRDAIGRRVRDTILPTLRIRFCDNSEAP